jgi:hypothetical protein
MPTFANAPSRQDLNDTPICRQMTCVYEWDVDDLTWRRSSSEAIFPGWNLWCCAVTSLTRSFQSASACSVCMCARVCLFIYACKYVVCVYIYIYTQRERERERDTHLHTCTCGHPWLHDSNRYTYIGAHPPAYPSTPHTKWQGHLTWSAWRNTAP